MKKFIILIIMCCVFSGCNIHRNKLKAEVVQAIIEGFQLGRDCALEEPKEVCDKALLNLYELKSDYLKGIK